MKSLNKDLQKSKSALVSLVYDFLDEVATFESDEYEISAEVTHDVTFKVKANSVEEAEAAYFYFENNEDAYQTRYEVNSVSKVDASARESVDCLAVENFILKLLAAIESNEEKEIA